MSTITKKAFAPVQLSAAAATYYTCPANTRATFKKLTVSNTDTVAHIVYFYLVPAAGAAGVTNIITTGQTVGALEARDIYEIEGHTIGALDFLAGYADAANKVTLQCTVVETTT